MQFRNILGVAEGYAPSVASVVTEVTVFLVFVIVCLNALGQGRRWLATLIWGSIMGFAAEAFLVSRPNPRYEYGLENFFLVALDVPVCIGVGWGMVAYVATWTAQRLSYRSIAVSSLIAGALGVNLDLSLDPVANMLGFWTWHVIQGHPNASPNPGAIPGADIALFRVPFDNFVAWIGLIGVYGGCVRKIFRWLNEKTFHGKKGPPGGASLSARGKWYLDAFAPGAAGLVAAVVFGVIRTQAQWVYELLGKLGGGTNGGELWVFALLFFSGLVATWYGLFRGSRNEDVNWVVLGVVGYFHVLSFALLLYHGVSSAPELVVLIPINLTAGMLAYLWPSIDTLFEKMTKVEANEFRMPYLVRRTLSSYGGTKVRASVFAPATLRELRAVLAFAAESKKQVTFRAGGLAFDTQSLNEQLVVSLHRFDRIEIDTDRQEVTVGCGATWGSILKKTLAEGLAPYIMVTSSTATAGGTLSANSLTRFSPTCGREGKYVTRFQLLTPDGRLWECSNEPGSANYELFLAVIGGLGYVGAVTEITYRLHKLPDKRSVVKTEFTLIDGLDRIAAGVRVESLVQEFVQETQVRCRKGSTNVAPLALSAAVNMRGGAWGLIARSQYVKEEPLRRSVFHNPSSLQHTVLQLCALLPGLKTLGYRLIRHYYKKSPKTYVDDAHGYTFFEDGNRRVRRLLHYLGIPCPIVQQTFILPYDLDGETSATSALLAFMKEADEYLDGCGLSPTLIDVLYVAQDDHDFVLSSSRRLGGFAVTFTFERLFRQLEREGRALRQISKICEKYQGRVHLTKNVMADSVVLEKMYAAPIQLMRKVRSTSAQGPLLSNEFSERALRGFRP